MPNILINPNSGIIEFNVDRAGVSSFSANFTGGAFANRMSYDNYGGLNLTSYVSNITGLDRFTIDGSNGRLFSVTDNLSGSLFSVNDIAGLPIIEAFDDNTVVMGAFNRNDFVLSGNCLGLGKVPNTGSAKLDINGNLYVSNLTSGLSGIFGRNHSFAGTDLTIVGGEINRISGNESAIIGGFNNTISGCFSNINGGCLNIVNANFGIINNGRSNLIGNPAGFTASTTLYTVNNVIEGGSSNCITQGPNNSVIIGGNSNCISSVLPGTVLVCGQSIIGGNSNSLPAGCYSSIIGGQCNCSILCNSSIIGGFCNYNASPCSVIVGGSCNTGVSNFVALGPNFIAGDKNRIETSLASSILGGCDNKICGSCSSIAGGNSNLVGLAGGGRVTSASFIGGGAFNIITGANPDFCGASNVIWSTIVGGYTNKITNCLASILGGRQNIVTHLGATVIGDGAARDKVSRGDCSLSLDFNGGIFLTGSNITLSPSPLPGRVDFCNSNLINATPNILNVNSNFSIGAGYNSRMILVNSPAAPVTGFLTSGQATGFNASLIQIGAGQIQITGSGIGVILNSYNNQYKSAGQYSTVSVLHTGDNGYIMYGNTI